MGLQKGIADYLTERFICNPEEVPDNECLVEAKYILSKITEVVEGAEVSPEDYFYLHANTPYRLSGRRVRMNAYLRGLDDGSKAMKDAILKALGEDSNDH